MATGGIDPGGGHDPNKESNRCPDCNSDWSFGGPCLCGHFRKLQLGSSFGTRAKIVLPGSRSELVPSSCAHETQMRNRRLIESPFETLFRNEYIHHDDQMGSWKQATSCDNQVLMKIELADQFIAVGLVLCVLPYGICFNIRVIFDVFIELGCLTHKVITVRLYGADWLLSNCKSIEFQFIDYENYNHVIKRFNIQDPGQNFQETLRTGVGFTVLHGGQRPFELMSAAESIRSGPLYEAPSNLRSSSSQSSNGGLNHFDDFSRDDTNLNDQSSNGGLDHFDDFSGDDTNSSDQYVNVSLQQLDEFSIYARNLSGQSSKGGSDHFDEYSSGVTSLYCQSGKEVSNRFHEFSIDATNSHCQSSKLVSDHFVEFSRDATNSNCKPSSGDFDHFDEPLTDAANCNGQPIKEDSDQFDEFSGDNIKSNRQPSDGAYCGGLDHIAEFSRDIDEPSNVSIQSDNHSCNETLDCASEHLNSHSIDKNSTNTFEGINDLRYSNFSSTYSSNDDEEINCHSNFRSSNICLNYTSTKADIRPCQPDDRSSWQLLTSLGGNLKQHRQNACFDQLPEVDIGQVIQPTDGSPGQLVTSADRSRSCAGQIGKVLLLTLRYEEIAHCFDQHSGLLNVLFKVETQEP